MRWIVLMLMMVACASGCRNSATTEEASRDETDLDLLQGVWVAEAYERDGQPVGAAVLRITQIIIEGDALELIESRQEGEMVTIKLDTSANPKKIDLRIAKGSDAGKIAPGIYRLDGDVLRICWAAPGQERPMAFTTINGKAVASLTLSRLRESD